MNLVSALFGLLAAATAAYMLICLFSVMLSWFPALGAGSLGDFARRASAPFFALFRGKKAPSGGISLAPIAGFVVLGTLFSLFSALASYGSITCALFLLTLLHLASSAVASLIIFVAMIAAVRLVFLLAKPRFNHAALSLAGRIVEPMVALVNRVAARDRILPYKHGLIIVIALLVLARVALIFLVELIAGWVQQIPF